MHRFGCCAGPISLRSGNRNSTTLLALLTTAALLLFFKPIGVDAGEGFYKRRFPVIDMACCPDS